MKYQPIKELNLNKYIEKFSEIKPRLDQICENLNIEQVVINNQGCKSSLIDKITKYLNNHDIVVSLERS